MRAVVQRVREAQVAIDDDIVGRIGVGLLAYVGVAAEDTSDDARDMARKIRHLRIFEDDAGKMNRDVSQAGGAVLVVSNFTLCADARQGRRPSFTGAAPPERAEGIYEEVVSELRASGVAVHTGRFRAMMRVSSVNDGPINILLESRGLF